MVSNTYDNTRCSWIMVSNTYDNTHGVLGLLLVTQQPIVVTGSHGSTDTNQESAIVVSTLCILFQSWFQNHRTQLRRSGSVLESVSPVAKVTSRVDSPTTPTPTTAPSPKQGPSAKEAPEVGTGIQTRMAASHAAISATCSTTYKPMTQVSVSPNHPFYFLTESRMDASPRSAKTLKRKTPSTSTKTPSPKSSGLREHAFSEPCLRRRRMTPRQRREHRKLTLRLLAQSTAVVNPDQPLDLSMKPAACDRLTPPAMNTQSSDVYSSERRRSAFLPMVGRNSTDPCYYPVTMAMGLMPYIGVNYPHFQSLLGHQWPVHGQLKK